MARWFLLLLVLLSFGLIGAGLIGRAGMTFSRSVWGTNIPGKDDPLTYVSISRRELDNSRTLYNHDPLADGTDTPRILSDAPGVPFDAANPGLYVYLPIQGYEAYAQIPIAERDLLPGVFDETPNSIYGVWVPAGRHGFQPIDPRTKEQLPGSYALFVAGSRDVTNLLNWQWRQERSWIYFVAGTSLLAVVSLVLLGGVLFGWKVPPKIPDSLKPFAPHLVSESPPWWVISRSFGVVCILVGFVGMLSAMAGGNALERGHFSVLTLAMAFLGAPVGWLLVGLGAQLCQRNVATRMRRKAYSPILYLRSFATDARWLEQPIDLLWILLFPGRFETSERSLTKSLAGAGPLVAIGQPGEMLPPMGAARLYVKDEKWQEVVAHLARTSGLIVLRVGNTDSFWWEVDHVIESCPPEKMLFMLPRGDQFRAYNTLAHYLAPRLKQYFPRPTSDMQFVGFRADWSPLLLGTSQATFISRFRQFLIGSAAPLMRDTLLAALRNAGYRVGRLPLQFREWILIAIGVSIPLGFAVTSGPYSIGNDWMDSWFAAIQFPGTIPISKIIVRPPMLIGVPKEVKRDEYRVAMLPVGVEELTAAGHTVLIETGSGLGSGIPDQEYSEQGAHMVATCEEIYARAELIVKVKEPLPQEYGLIRPGQTLFTYFHFAASRELTEAMLKSGATCIAYETLKDAQGRLPLLTPMSEVAGRMSIQEGAKYLERPQQGRGILLAGVPGVAPAHITILGGGVVGANAAKIAAGFQADIAILDVNMDRLRYLDDIMPPNVNVLFSDRHTIRQQLKLADLVIGAVLIPGAKAPHLVSRKDLKLMKPGSVIIDVAIDQGGCLETSRPTTHSAPVYLEEDVLHYCVTNMPGAVGRTSTFALCNVTLPWVLQLATRGIAPACEALPPLASAVNIRAGTVTNQAVADTFGMQLASANA